MREESRQSDKPRMADEDEKPTYAEVKKVMEELEAGCDAARRLPEKLRISPPRPCPVSCHDGSGVRILVF